MAIQIRRTRTPDHAPTDLVPGQLAVEMASSPARLWCGVPTSIDPSGRRLLGTSGGGGPSFKTGQAKPTLRKIAPPGWILMDDGTIGDALSGASTRANDDCEALFHLLWELGDERAPVGGVTPGDPLFPNVIFLVANGTRTDQSLRALALIPDGNQAPRPTWVAPAGGLPLPEVVDFDHINANWFTVPADWNLGTGDFCFEGYIRIGWLNYWQMIFADFLGTSFQIYVTNDNTLRARFAIGSGAWQFQTVPFGAVALNTWTHFAFYRLGNNFYGAKDGVPVLLGNIAGAPTNVSNLYIGNGPEPSQFWGQMAALRVTRGYSRYYATPFIPPSLPHRTVSVSGRGESAAEDWAAHKQITLPRQRGRAIVGAGHGAGLVDRPLGGWFGEESHSQTGAELPQHAHAVADPGHGHGSWTENRVYSWGHGYSGAESVAWYPHYWGGLTSGVTVNANVTGIGLYNAGSSAPFNVVQPSAAWNLMMKL